MLRSLSSILFFLITGTFASASPGAISEYKSYEPVSVVVGERLYMKENGGVNFSRSQGCLFSGVINDDIIVFSTAYEKSSDARLNVFYPSSLGFVKCAGLKFSIVSVSDVRIVLVPDKRSTRILRLRDYSIQQYKYTPL